MLLTSIDFPSRAIHLRDVVRNSAPSEPHTRRRMRRYPASLFMVTQKGSRCLARLGNFSFRGAHEKQVNPFETLESSKETKHSAESILAFEFLRNSEERSVVSVVYTNFHSRLSFASYSPDAWSVDLRQLAVVSRQRRSEIFLLSRWEFPHSELSSYIRCVENGTVSNWDLTCWFSLRTQGTSRSEILGRAGPSIFR